jgi:hypothetical protein
MDHKTFANISRIIERDSKSTTYKLALLRGTIDIINENSPFIKTGEGRAQIPLGLLIEKWLLYYYPIFESEIKIPQINGSTDIAFGKNLKALTDAYKGKGGLSAFYTDLIGSKFQKGEQPFLIMLTRQIAQTIIKMPMRYIGKSVTGQEYGLYKYRLPKTKNNSTTFDLNYLIDSFGSFSIPIEYFDAFRVLGSFIGGQDAILFKWAEFSVQASSKNLSIPQVLGEVLKSPITDREVSASKAFYKSLLESRSTVYCVWSGKKLTRYDIDHIIPFTVWKNNDLWNLLPVHPSLNNQKRDKIPSIDLIENQQSLIKEYWSMLNQAKPNRFQTELRVALSGDSNDTDWQGHAITQLKNSCDYLINTRGFDEWAPVV